MRSVCGTIYLTVTEIAGRTTSQPSAANHLGISCITLLLELQPSGIPLPLTSEITEEGIIARQDEHHKANSKGLTLEVVLIQEGSVRHMENARLHDKCISESHDNLSSCVNIFGTTRCLRYSYSRRRLVMLAV